MLRRQVLPLLVALTSGRTALAQSGGVFVIGHPGVDRLDVPTVQRIYTGRIVELSGLAITPVNVGAGSPVRARFLQTYLNQDEDRYVAYWTVRRYIGKGVPPKDLGTPAEVIRFVQSTPGAIGYVDEANLVPGLNVLIR